MFFLQFLLLNSDRFEIIVRCFTRVAFLVTATIHKHLENYHISKSKPLRKFIRVSQHKRRRFIQERVWNLHQKCFTYDGCRYCIVNISK